jgi:hypothetical protein
MFGCYVNPPYLKNATGDTLIFRGYKKWSCVIQATYIV